MSCPKRSIPYELLYYMSKSHHFRTKHKEMAVLFRIYLITPHTCTYCKLRDMMTMVLSAEPLVNITNYVHVSREREREREREKECYLFYLFLCNLLLPDGWICMRIFVTNNLSTVYFNGIIHILRTWSTFILQSSMTR